jgi:hypothetical protein
MIHFIVTIHHHLRHAFIVTYHTPLIKTQEEDYFNTKQIGSANIENIDTYLDISIWSFTTTTTEIYLS